MKSTEGSIQIYRPIATIVAFEIFVVEIVKIVTCFDVNTFKQHDAIKSGMALSRCDGRMLGMEQSMDWVRRDDPMYKNTAPI